jgi:hypothetical protein
MNAWTIATVCPSDKRLGVKSSASKNPKRPRAPSAANRSKFLMAATGSTIAASAVA